MAVSTITQVVPLVTDKDGVIRVGGTRVPLETVIFAFTQGASAEEIVIQYSALKLADVYSVIGYYLNHQEEVSRYLEQVEREEQQMRQFVESHWDQKGIRERLLARRPK
jgi:uncharacterized protein (DUF433 family)